VTAATTPRTGLTRAVDQPDLLGQDPVALCTNYTAVADDLGRGVDALRAAGVPVAALLTPEHGYWGAAQAGASDGDGTDPASGLPVLDTYQVSGAELDTLLGRTGADHVVIDLQDVGTRFYTYTWTLFDLLCSAARTGRRVTVLDRPNPLGRRPAGPGLDAACSSFVGRVSVPLRHGLTLGELARWFAAEHVPAATGRSPALDVVTVQGWDGRPGSGEPWVLPSPNLPTRDSAVLYPVTGLIEGTTLSEGRGTTRPFELFGAAWTDAALAAALREQDLPGVAVREAVFRPTFSKWAGETVHGAQLHVLDPGAVDPVTTGHAVLRTVADLYPDQPLWRGRSDGHPPFVDLLWGSPSLREGIDSGAGLADILAVAPAAPLPPSGALLYPTHPAEVPA